MSNNETSRSPEFYPDEQTLAKSVADAAEQADGAFAAAGQYDQAAVSLAKSLDDLPEDQQQALRLRHLEGWPLNRIAEDMGKPPGEIARLLLGGATALHESTTRVERPGESSSAAKDETAADTRAGDTLADYLSEVDGGSIVAPGQVITEHPHDAGELQTYFEVAEKLNRAASMMGETLQSTPGELAKRDTQVAADTLPETASQPFEVREFGDYQLLNIIGAGGMGVVYKARQANLNRIVAVKMIRSGQFAGDEDVQRFRAEAEAAGNLRHPNIVAVHEVGQHDGQHFFSMDYIEGESLLDVTRENALPPRRAAELVKTVAESMQFCHGRGILHRDLKPANILLDATQGDRPMITDFGLAKRIDDDSGMTATGMVLGTPSYSPPEQLEGRADEVGAASDVYSLGGVLYELLTGRPPFRGSSPFDTMKQAIRVEPVAPRMLNADLPRDLETICLKCLQKNPAARYASAQELADELGRYLAGEPILARPVSRMTRTMRWCKRNPKLAASLTATAATILIALVVVSISLAVTSDALKGEKTAREQSERSFAMAREAVDELFTEVSENALLNQPGLQPLRQDLLKRTQRYYQRFLDERGADPSLRDELALAHFRIGLITETIGSAEAALEHLDKARAQQVKLLERTPDDVDRRYALANTLNATGIVLYKTGKQDESLQAHREALAIRAKLAADAPERDEMQRKLANSQMNIGILEKAGGRFDEARRGMDQAQEIRGTALKKNDNAKLKRDLGKGWFNLANLDLAVQSQALNDRDERLADEQEKLAVGHLKKAIEVFEQLFQKQPNDFTNQIQLATCYNLLADLKSYRGQQDEAARAEAIQLYDDAQPILESLARMNPDVARFQSRLAGLYLNLGMLYSVDQRTNEALAAYQPAKQTLEQLAKRFPNVIDYQIDLANSLRAIATTQAQLKQWQPARANLDSALKILNSAAQAARPGIFDFQRLIMETKSDIQRLEALQNEANR